MNIQTLIDIEEILLKADNDLRYSYSLDELIKSEKYLEELGKITNLFFSVQLEFSKLYSDEELLKIYYNKLSSDDIDIDIAKYVTFIKKISDRLTDKDYFDKVKKILEFIKPQ